MITATPSAEKIRKTAKAFITPTEMCIRDSLWNHSLTVTGMTGKRSSVYQLRRRESRRRTGSRCFTEDVYKRQMLYGGDYNPNQWPKEIWDEDMKLFHQAGINSTTINVFSWAKMCIRDRSQPVRCRRHR